MRVVVDTNVLVSALLHPGRTPDRALASLFTRGDTALYDERILAEYRDVLRRDKFRKIERAEIEALLSRILTTGEKTDLPPPYAGEMVDTDDRIFVEVALAGRAAAIITGNVRHFPRDLGIKIVSPGEFLERVIDASL